MNRAKTEVPTAIKNEESNGLTIVHARLPFVVTPELESIEANAGMREAIKSPTTSSMMAALMRTVPMRVC